MSKYTVNMADQLNKIRMDAQEKLKKDSEVVVEPAKPSLLQQSTAEYLSNKEERHPLSPVQNLNEALSPQDKKVVDAFYYTDKPMTGKILSTDGKTLEKTGMGAQTIAKVIPQSGGKFKVVAKMDSKSTQEIVRYIKKTFPKKLVTYEEVELKEGKMSQLHLYIKQGKTAKEIAKLMGVDAKTIQKLMAAYESRDAKKEDMQEHKGTTPHKHPHEDELDEREKSVRQLINPNKEVMIVKKNKVMVVDKKYQDKYMKQGWALAEEVELDEAEGSIIIGKNVSDMALRNILGLAKKTGLKVTKQEKRKDGGTTIHLKGNQRALLDLQTAASNKSFKLGASIGEETELDENVQSDVKKALGKISHKLIKKGNKNIIQVNFNDEEDAQQAIKNHPLYVSGKLRVQPMGEEVKLEEARWKVKIEGLPSIYMDSSSAGEVKSQLRKLLKKPDMIQDIERVTDAEVKKGLRDRISGKEVEEAKLIDKPTGEVLKTGSKEKMETEKKRNRDELQVKEWFKAKNIAVHVRELDESTQVYVPIGRRIPNEIREELIMTQYGKMPEDVKNVKDINYGNFMENSITMNNDFWTKVLHGTKGE